MAAPRRPTVSLDALLAAWLATTGSNNTRAAYTRDLQVFISWATQAGVAPLSATAVHIDVFRVHCEAAGASPATVHRRLSALSSFYRHATAAAPNPVDGASRPAAPASPTLALPALDAARVWAAATALGPRTAALIGLLMHDGLKTGDVLPLDVGDVRFGRGVTVLAVAVPRAVDPRTSPWLRRHVGARRDGPLFVGDNPTRQPARLTRFGVDYLVKRTGAAAGLITPLTVNTLRRSATP